MVRRVDLGGDELHTATGRRYLIHPLRRVFLRLLDKEIDEQIKRTRSNKLLRRAASVGASLTLTEIGVMVGIVTALLTFVLNMVYMYRKDQREQRESDAHLASLAWKQ